MMYSMHICAHTYYTQYTFSQHMHTLTHMPSTYVHVYTHTYHLCVQAHHIHVHTYHTMYTMHTRVHIYHTYVTTHVSSRAHTCNTCIHVHIILQCTHVHHTYTYTLHTHTCAQSLPHTCLHWYTHSYVCKYTRVSCTYVICAHVCSQRASV